jgi:sulfotransferase 6B1
MPNFRYILRQTVYETEKLAQRVKFAFLPTPANGWPVLIGISFPKSGTHLLDQVLLGFSGVAPFSRRLHSFYAQYDGDTGRKRSSAETIAWLDSLRPLDITSAHLFSSPEALQRVCTPAFVPYFIYRDPRDVAVSHVFYVTEMEKNHVHHAYYQSLPDFDARLRASILGIPNSAVEFPDIAGRFAPYMGWINRPEVLNLHFEDFIHDRPGTLNRIVDHFLARVSLTTPRISILESLESAINPQKSPTFRSGKTGEWQKYFKDEHKAIFKEVAGDLLIRLRYEQDNDW